MIHMQHYVEKGGKTSFACTKSDSTCPACDAGLPTRKLIVGGHATIRVNGVPLPLHGFVHFHAPPTLGPIKDWLRRKPRDW